MARIKTPAGSRRGSPRVGDVVLIAHLDGSGYTRTLVTRVAVRQVKIGDFVSERYAIDTAAFGFDGYRSRGDFYLLAA